MVEYEVLWGVWYCSGIGYDLYVVYVLVLVVWCEYVLVEYVLVIWC